MNIPGILLACLLATTLAGQASAEIYESEDADGNPVFSDTPMVGSEAVDLPRTNTADAPADIPDAPRQAAPGAAGAANPDREGQSQTVIIGDTHNERLEREVEEHRRQEVLDAEKRHEAGEGEIIGERERPEHIEGAPPKASPKVHPHRAAPGR